MEITPNELREREITKAFRGLDENEVHELLDRAADTIEALQSRVRQLSAMAVEGQSPPATTANASAEPTTAAAARTLELAQRVADETVEEAKATAATIVTEAETTGARLVADAQAEADRVRIEEQGRVEAEIAVLDSRRGNLNEAVQALETFERSYRDRLLTIVRDDLARFEARTVPDAASDASLAGVVSVAAQGDARGTEPVAAGTDQGESGPPTELVTTTQPATEATESADAGVADTGSDDGDTTTAANDDASATSESGTSEFGVASATSESILDPEPKAEPKTELGETSTRVPLIGSAIDSSDAISAVMPTIDLAHEQAAERDALAQLVAGGEVDDDDFFTSLREATSEHAALAPGEPQLFHSDDDRDSTFRDVFRRRR